MRSSIHYIFHINYICYFVILQVATYYAKNIFEMIEQKRCGMKNNYFYILLTNYGWCICKQKINYEFVIFSPEFASCINRNHRETHEILQKNNAHFLFQESYHLFIINMFGYEWILILFDSFWFISQENQCHGWYFNQQSCKVVYF